jgi:hypothetical protein
LGEQDLVQRIFGSSAVPPSDTYFVHDIRVPGNVTVESRNGAIFVYESEFSGKVLFEGQSLDPAVFAALGSPELLVIFCHYESGGSFGYAIVKNGMTVRSRVYMAWKTKDEGVPNEFELPWLQAETFIEEEGCPAVYRNLKTGKVANESSVTSRLLVEVMNAFFGVAPWDAWDPRSKLNHYSREKPFAKTTEPVSERAWWKFW